MHVIYVLLALTAFSVSAADEWFPGENLLTQFQPSSDEWDAYEKKEGNYYSRMWRKKSGVDERYAVSVIRGYDRSFEQFREMQDGSGRASCDDFQSNVLTEDSVNNYPRIIWRTLCANEDGFTASILHLAIKGNDSFYHVMKTWRSDVAEEDLATWNDRLLEISVCDTRDADRPCPSGFERVES